MIFGHYTRNVVSPRTIKTFEKRNTRRNCCHRKAIVFMCVGNYQNNRCSLTGRTRPRSSITCFNEVAVHCILPWPQVLAENLQLSPCDDSNCQRMDFTWKPPCSEPHLIIFSHQMATTCCLKFSSQLMTTTYPTSNILTDFHTYWHTHACWHQHLHTDTHTHIYSVYRHFHTYKSIRRLLNLGCLIWISFYLSQCSVKIDNHI